MYYYFFNGQQSGGNITFDRVIALSSRFNRGMIFYRKLTDGIQSSINLVNQTLIFDGNPESYPRSYYSVVILSSRFTQLNAFRSVTALARQFTSQLTTTLTRQVYQPIYLQKPIHLGIILNLKDYPGSIIIQQSRFERNIHFLSEFNNTVMFESERRSLSEYLYRVNEKVQEYKLGICQPYLSPSSSYLFGQGYLKETMDIEDYFEEFERLSLLYLSRVEGFIIIKKNTFVDNVGTFGGAIAIDLPQFNEQSLVVPYILIQQNDFQNNTAYLSGNAIYIRLGIYEEDYEGHCGTGIRIALNSFANNIGTKISNGGAISIICTYLKRSVNKQTSAVSLPIIWKWNNTYVTDQVFLGEGRQTKVLSVSQPMNFDNLNLASNNFVSNYAGYRGTSVYLHYITATVSLYNTYQNNTAVNSTLEKQYSPLSKYFINGKAFTFLDQIYYFKNEADFMLAINNYSTSLKNQLMSKTSNINTLNFQSYQVQGALALFYPEKDDSFVKRFHTFSDSQSLYLNNDGGLMHRNNFKSNTSSNVYIENGNYVVFLLCQFSDNYRGFIVDYDNNTDEDQYKTLNYLTSSQQSTMIVIQVKSSYVSTQTYMTYAFINKLVEIELFYQINLLSKVLFQTLFDSSY